MEQETNETLPQAVPEKKKKTLTEKQIKNLELMRNKKMEKKKNRELEKENRETEKNQREPEKNHRETEKTNKLNEKKYIDKFKEDEITDLKKQLHELKEQISKKNAIKKSIKSKSNSNSNSNSNSSSPPNLKRKKVFKRYKEDDDEYCYKYINPYLNQLVRGR